MPPSAAARKCLNVARILGRVAQRFPQLLDRRIQAVLEINEGVVGPQPLAKLLAGDDFAGVLEQHGEDLERLVRQPDLDAAPEQFARLQVGLEYSEAGNPGGLEAQESPDGLYLYYAKRETSGIWRLPLGGSGDVREEKILDLGGEGRWSLRPDGIFVLDGWPTRSPGIRFFDFAATRVSDVVALPSDWYFIWYFILMGGAFAVSPDGKWAIVTQERLVESDIMLVENFR